MQEVLIASSLRLSIVVLPSVCAAFAARQGKRFITEKDLFKFTWIADPQISPDGSTVAFVRVTVNEKDDRYETSLFTVPASGAEAPRRLTSGTRDTAPRWSPDGKRIAFVRAIEKDGKPQPAQIYLLAMDGGEARALTDLRAARASRRGRPTAQRSRSRSRPVAEDAKTTRREAKPAREKERRRR